VRARGGWRWGRAGRGRGFGLQHAPPIQRGRATSRLGWRPRPEVALPCGHGRVKRVVPGQLAPEGPDGAGAVEEVALRERMTTQVRVRGGGGVREGGREKA
jgi:hypothetical protein